MKRRAFIGYSTPLAYDYKNPAAKSPSDAPYSDSPNPILDAPFGLMLLFDEIVFACRSLCPQNMRGLPYVRFLDEEGRAPELSDLSYDAISDGSRRAEEKARAERPGNALGYDEIVLAAGVHWNGWDNHSRGITVGGFTAMGNQTFRNAFLDSVILERLKDPSLELIGNSFLQQFSDDHRSSLAKAKLAETLVIGDVHSYQTAAGPYHPVIDEARADKHLESFRQWMAERRASVNQKELAEVRDAVEASLRKVQDELFLKWLDPKGHAINIGKSVIVEGVNLLLPGASVVAEMVKEDLHYKKARELRWQGFIVGARNKLK